MTYQNLKGNEERKVVFEKLPTNLEELKALPEASLKEPHFAAALLIPALCVWNTNKEEAIKMINFLKGPAELSTYDKQFISERLSGNDYVAKSYFDGAVADNAYQGSEPLTVTMRVSSAKFAEAEYLRFDLKSGGADTARPVTVRVKPSTGEWFLWEQMLLAQIRKPTEQDPWA